MAILLIARPDTNKLVKIFLFIVIFLISLLVIIKKT
ncbi:sortase B protein-sorting domain-containing protein [Thalassomonas haliotis]|uniref:Sortase B protein-sorting domain-containing protein n=1 Tax=Thalassomonas haliotis TaxID=485448 RepID=A0ABY7VNG6_9GAMM|nr:sortase B protein-sorting domain-containing protein [Thalassomonas haliotis]